MGSHRGERHGRDKEYWGGQPARSDERRAAAAAEELEPAKRGRGRHDRKTFCKKLHGPHVAQKERRDGVWHCKWVPDFHREDRRWEGARWACYHELRCEGCGKVLEHRLPTVGDCPDYPGHDEQRHAAIADAVRTQERYESRAWWPQRRRNLGQRGYRKPKPGRGAS